MVYSFYNSGSSSAGGSDISRLFISPPNSLHNQHGASYSNCVVSPTSGLVASSSHNNSLLVLESEKGVLVNNNGSSATTARIGKNKISEVKALAALKSHSEAERRRRERINGHLATLRGLVPSTDKMDKAALLAKVVSQVKELKKNAMEASKGLLIPTDADEVEVEPHDDGGGDGSMSYKASMCCDFRPEILSDIRHTLDALQLRLVRAEMSTFEGRMKNVFVYKCCEGSNVNNEACQALARTVHKALSAVLDKANSSLEYSLRASFPSKRRRICLVETSTSSCNHDSCSG